jgi:hypothetical protein
MKKIAFIIAGCFFITFGFAQDSTVLQSTVAPGYSSTSKLKMKNRPADHLMIQLSSDHWAGMPDSIDSHQEGFSRGFNAYFMFDKPFRNSPKFSIGIGAGISTSNIFFKRMNVDLISTSELLPFKALDSTNHFKKYKVATSYLEVPLEFRFTSNPDNINKSFKAALGLKVGTLVNAHTKGKSLQDKNNNLVNAFVEKENSKRYINSTRFMGTARFGYGIISLFGSYQLNKILKDGLGPDMNLYQVGLTLSGM